MACKSGWSELTKIHDPPSCGRNEATCEMGQNIGFVTVVLWCFFNTPAEHSRTVIYWTSAMTGLSATWRHTRGSNAGSSSPLIGKFKLPQKVWGMNKLSSNLQKKKEHFCCWNFATIGMIGMVFVYLQKMWKSLSLSSQQNIEVHVLQNFSGTCHVSDFVGPETLLKISSFAAQLQGCKKRRRIWGFVRTFNTPKSWSCSQYV